MQSHRLASLLGSLATAILFACGFPGTFADTQPSQSYLQFQFSGFSVYENQTNAVITVLRTGDTRTQTAVDYTVSAGTATEGDDFTPVGGRLIFAPNQCVRTFLVPIVSDTEVEGDETVLLTLDNAASNAIVLQATATLTISDAPANPAPVPPLAVGPGSDGTIIVSWSGDRMDCFVERSSNPATGNWTRVTSPVMLVEGRLSIEEPASGDLYLYRLSTH